MKIQRIPEWRDAWRFASVQIAAAAALVGLLAPDQLAALLVFGVAFILARVLKKAD